MHARVCRTCAGANPCVSSQPLQTLQADRSQCPRVARTDTSPPVRYPCLACLPPLPPFHADDEIREAASSEQESLSQSRESLNRLGSQAPSQQSLYSALLSNDMTGDSAGQSSREFFAEHLPRVCLLFADVEGFTSIASKLKAGLSLLSPLSLFLCTHTCI